MDALRKSTVATKRTSRGWLGGLTRRKVLVGLAIASFFWGSGDGRTHLAQGAAPKPRAWFDAKGAFVFPLAGADLPENRQQLTDAMADGWKAHLRFPADEPIVQTTGGRYPALGEIKVHLDGGVSKPPADDGSDLTLRPSGRVLNKLAVREFSLTADPIVSEKAKMSIFINASDARMDVERDIHGKPMMMLGDAREAAFSFEATRADLERIIAYDLNLMGKRYGVRVLKAKLKIEAVNNRSIDVDLHLSTLVALIPAGMRFQAHVDIDQSMNGKLSHLRCEGDEALGPLISGLIRPGLAKYEGKSRPIFSFPTGQMELHDVEIQGGEDVKVSAKFSR